MDTTSKRCSKCSEVKPIDKFNPKKTGGFQSWCRSCKNESSRNWYHRSADNKQKRSEQVYARITENKDKAIEYLGGKCKDCGGVFHRSVYDFHHLDESQKELALSKGRFMSWDKYKAELDKCVLLCSNCHRIRHHLREEKQVWQPPVK
jgi:predicted HNH restriction endonuclease